MDPEAHEAYLKGRFYWNQRTTEGLTTGVRFFQAAIEIDPDYALAHVGLADSQLLLTWFLIGVLRPSEGIPRAKVSLARALEIDDLLGEAHVTNANVAHYERDWPLGEREMKRAIELSPNYARGHMVQGMHLSIMGRHPEAIAAARRARQLDPLSLITTVVVGLTLYKDRKKG